jgi:hypothetical protein
MSNHKQKFLEKYYRRPIYHCNECGTSDIQLQAWVQQTEIGHLQYVDLVMDNPESGWCNQCSESVEVNYNKSTEVRNVWNDS